MATGLLHDVLTHLRGVTTPTVGSEMKDGEHLERFITCRDEASFAALVRRHGPMVLGVCRRVLHHAHDAEDAFQTAFLVLARKAPVIGRRELLGNWLYGVAYRAALEVKAARRRARETRGHAMHEPAAPTVTDPWLDLWPLLDQELHRLPDKYRVPVVLCDLEGRTRRDAARQLGLPVGTLSGRLTTARRTLAQRLARRGYAVTSATMPALLSQVAAPVAVAKELLAATAKAATGSISAKIAPLTEGVLNAMLLTKTKALAALFLLTAGLLGTAAAVAIYHDPPPREKPAAATDTEPKKDVAPAKRFENAPGWSWYGEEPRRRNSLGTSFGMGGMAGTGISAMFDQDKDEALIVYLAFRRSEATLDFRPIAFDSERKRYPLQLAQGNGHYDVWLSRYRLDPKALPIAKAVYLGFEVLSAEGRKVAANAAFERARKAGIAVLPFPEVGKPYLFSLTTADGKKLCSSDFRGKVVLIDCWATWCAPCMAKMPELKELYEKHRAEGLEVVGVSFDHDAKKARQAVERLKLAWPQVLVPTDETARSLWSEAGGIDSLPRLLLVDGEGILRAECRPGDLKEQLSKLMATRKPATESKR